MFDMSGAWGDTSYFAQFTSVLFIVNILIALTIIFLERKNPSATLAWIMVLFLLPIIGIALYFLFSQNIVRKKIFKLTRGEQESIGSSLEKQHEMIKDGEFNFTTNAAKHWSDMIQLNLIYGLSYYTQDNKVNIITDGNHMMDSLLKDIQNAQHVVNIMFFIIKPDIAGYRLIDVLTEKARQGVTVRLLMDAMGSRKMNDELLTGFIDAGGRHAYFFPSKFKPANLKFNYRNHRKLVSIDGKIGYIGGFNIGREYLGLKRKFGYWRDTHLRLIGSCVQDIDARFLLDWRFASEEKVRISESLYEEPVGDGITGVQIVSSGPDSNRVGVKRAYMKMIASARQNIYIQTPYFVPDSTILESLKMAAQSGVDVRIMIPCKPDHIFVYWATYAYVGELIASGGKVYIYDNGFLHAKTMVVDGEAATVGSANFDRRSFRLNFEANAFLYDAEQAYKLESIFETDMANCHELTKELYDKRSLWIRFKEAIAVLLSDLL